MTDSQLERQALRVLLGIGAAFVAACVIYAGLYEPTPSHDPMHGPTEAHWHEPGMQGLPHTHLRRRHAGMSNAAHAEEHEEMCRRDSIGCVDHVLRESEF